MNNNSALRNLVEITYEKMPEEEKESLLPPELNNADLSPESKKILQLSFLAKTISIGFDDFSIQLLEEIQIVDVFRCLSQIDLSFFMSQMPSTIDPSKLN